MRRALLLSLCLHLLGLAGWWCWRMPDAAAVADKPMEVSLDGGSGHAKGGAEPQRRASGQGRRAREAPAPAISAVRGAEESPRLLVAAPGAAGRNEAATAAGEPRAAYGGAAENGASKGSGASKDQGRNDDDHEALYRPAYLENPQPSYPERSLQLGEEGEVLLRVTVGVNGRALKVKLAHGSGFRRLDQAALDAVARWRFVPARRGGTVVESELTVPVRFQPRN